MLLTIDIGNTTTVFGVFDHEKLKKKWNIETLKLEGENPDSRLRLKTNSPVIVSSVVPSKDKIIKKIFPHAYFVTAENIKGIEVRAKKSEVGADRVINALAAKELYGSPAIVVDFGTATTFDVVSANGEYLGGAISPGIGLSSEILHQATAKLPVIQIKAPKYLIGKNTKDAIRSGLVYGYVSMVEGMVNKLKSKIPIKRKKIKVIATGGFAKLIAKYTESINIVDPNLTLLGLRLAHEKQQEFQLNA